MDFYEWSESNNYYAKSYRKRIKAGEKGNKSNPIMAAKIAYKAGIDEGKRLAAEKLKNIVLK
jgi:hypothetical protein